MKLILTLNGQSRPQSSSAPDGELVYPVTNTLPHGTQIGIYSLFSSCTGHRRRKTKEQKP